MTQQKLVLTLLLLFLSIVSFTIPLSAQSSTREEGGRVSGLVLDLNNARVTNAKITIKSRNFSREVFTGEVGEFDIALPAGEYQFSVEANGFCRFERESLKIHPRTTEMINIHLEVAVYDSPDSCKCTSRRRHN